MSETKIEWTDVSWNPTTGCSKVSPGCKHCYAETITRRFPKHFKDGFRFTIHRDRYDEPAQWKKPKRVFVNSMSDLFHEEMPLEEIQRLFEIMGSLPRHQFQILTKRHQRLLALAPSLTWYSNIWMGVSIESQTQAKRCNYLRMVPAAVRFLSCEPLLGPLTLDLGFKPKLDPANWPTITNAIDWVIVGGESGRYARPMQLEWVYGLLRQARSCGARPSL